MIGGRSIPVVDLIDDLPPSTDKSQFPCDSGWSQAPRRQQEPVQYWGAAPSLTKTWGWAHVCIEIVRYHMFGCLRPVREDICRDIVLTADCDDITADVIFADHNFSQSAMLTSSLLITASSSRHADVIIVDSRFLFTSTSDSFTLAHLSDCDDITADVIFADHNFSQSAMLTSSLLITASSSRHADVIIVDSRFLFTSTSDSFTLAQQLVLVLHNWFQTSTI
ncbi:hypothetical protein F511_28600 [Dorcoceras hygrometricum]|uniref:Uncharacterized protein n=1 Tax=Dorcoceras hygrometricum TaxID=472368 RepID=A0A2Z7ADQ6_9LAMI|nr:hypothetical protein F511_28600 [Dorcoceras hygrometricum]